MPNSSLTPPKSCVCRQDSSTERRDEGGASGGGMGIFTFRDRIGTIEETSEPQTPFENVSSEEPLVSSSNASRHLMLPLSLTLANINRPSNTHNRTSSHRLSCSSVVHNLSSLNSFDRWLVGPGSSQVTVDKY